jgi:SRSO17 transposase
MSALAAGIAPGVLLADTGCDVDGVFGCGVTAVGLTYAMGVQSAPSVWGP